MISPPHLRWESRSASYLVLDPISGVKVSLLKLYADQQANGYYDPALLRNQGGRYHLFFLAVVCMGTVAIVVPLLR